MSKFIILFIAYTISANLLFAQKSNCFSDSIFNLYVDNFRTANAFQIIKKEKSTDLIPCGLKVVREVSPIISIVKLQTPLANCKTNYKEFAFSPANDLWKLSPPLEKIVRNNKKFGTESKTLIIASSDLEKMLHRWVLIDKNLVVQNIYPSSNTAVIRCNKNVFFNKFLQDDDLFFVDEYIKPTNEVELVGYDRSQNEIQRIHQLIPNANGKEITIGIKETNLQEGDIDLLKRVKTSSLADLNKDPHATVVAGLAGGAGNSSITGKGLAWASSFYSSSFSNLFPDNNTTLATNNVSVQNHSYGTINQNFYGAEAAAYDAQIYNVANNRLHIFSSGNRGLDAANGGLYNGIRSFSNLTGNFKQSKNIITVGATDTSNNLISFSSVGPLYDGRMAPQICALGPNGTSDAAAIVSGSAALLQQIYKDSNNQQLPPAALVKALLFTSTTDIGQPGIDFKTGFGSLNSYKAATIVQSKQYFSGMVGANETWTQSLQLPTNAINIKATLAWTDTAAPINNVRALINDLDLVMSEVGGGVNYLPWVLSTFPNADSLNKPALRKRDSLNTAEQVTIESSSTNNFIITVIGNRVITSTKQPFYIAYTYDTLNSFSFTNPLNASDINKDESSFVRIKWDVVTASTAKGDLSVSYNNGLIWHSLATQLLLSNKSYNWLLPDTSSMVLFKMNTTFGSFLSPSFILAPVTKLKVGFYCADSIQLKWNKYIYANNYQVFSLTDSAYLKPIVLTSDTTVTLRTSNVNNTYAVQPILSNGLYATRSAAIDVPKQGVLCYYSSFTGIDEGTKIKLLLTLSLPEKTDSIIIEKITASGNLIRKLANINMIGFQSDFDAIDNSPTKGSNYYRAIIYVKNKGGYFTERVLVISNANDPVFIYPNPVKREQTFNFQLSDFSVGNTLSLFDTKGRQIKTYNIGQAGTIPTKGLPLGCYIYLISKKDGRKYATGKIIIN